MKTTNANLRNVDILGTGSRSAQEILTAAVKRCRQRIGYLSVFVTLPALLLPNVHEARTETIKRTEAMVPEDASKLNAKLSAEKISGLLKRQSKFRLPHQNNLSLAVQGVDDCPGHPIPEGTYSAGSPYTEVGDTTGANNTFNAFYCYSCFYLTVNTPGPDHIYSFLLTSLGSNPEIEVLSNSSTFSPLIYILEGGFQDACPSGGFAGNGLMFSESTNHVATINSQAMRRLSVNKPFYLVIDSREVTAGSYTLKMQDVTIAPTVGNPIDDPGFFVSQQYIDFLGRSPDPDGHRFWLNEITSCGGDQSCIEARRINDSGAFFLSIEFQETGYLLYRTHKAAYGNRLNEPVPMNINDFWNGRWQLQNGVIVNQPGWQQVLETNKQNFFKNFVSTQQFISGYPGSLTPSQFVNALFSTAGVNPTSSERQAAINEFGGAPFASDLFARARALRRVAENSTLAAQEFNRAFVLMQYFGYLFRNPNDFPDGNFDGYNFWLDKLNRFNGDFKGAEMVKAFLSSVEYRHRFGP